MPKAKDYTGVIYKELTYIRPTEGRENKKIVWEAKCSCGNIFYTVPNSLYTCGCVGRGKDWTNKRFGWLTYIEPTNKRSAGTMGVIIWKAKCDCGKICERVPNDTQSCGCMRSPDWTGKKFGKLTLIEPTDRIVCGRPIWKVLCDCGNTHYALASHVKGGLVKSCGCLTKRQYHPRISTARVVWYNYKECPFDIFLELSQMPCHYCGRDPFKTTNRRHKYDSEFQKKEGNFTYNGLDRVDSNKGHTVDNVVPCCIICNRMKLDYTVKEFYEHIDRIRRHARASKITDNSIIELFSML